MSIELSDGLVRLVLAPQHGGHWLSLTFGDQPLLVPIKESELPQRAFSGGCYVMAPWCNRVRDAQFFFGGRKYALKPNFFDGTAIHGDVWSRPFHVVNQTPSRVELKAKSTDWVGFNFPFALEFIYTIQVKDNSVRAEFKITNLHAELVPVGFGFHPFFWPDVSVQLNAQEFFPIKLGIPQEPATPVAARRDLRSSQMLSPEEWDDQYASLQRPVALVESAGLKVTVDADEIFNHCFVYAPPDKKQTPRPFVAVEPMTMISDGFNLLEQGWKETGVRVLLPGETWGGGITISLE